MSGPSGAGARTRPAGHPVVALTVAGSDPSGGAGIQADLKTFAAVGGYGCAVLTGLTAQSTTGVTRVWPVPADMVTDQLETLLADVAVDAVKIGMTTNAAVGAAVADVLAALRSAGTAPVVVLDPVMVATSGDRLLEPAAEEVLRDRLLPLADLVTPNAPEAAALLRTAPATTADEAAGQARALRDMGPAWALVKGGHLPAGPDDAVVVDQLAGPDGVTPLAGRRVATSSTHGTGCTLSSACAVLRPVRDGWVPAVRDARAYLARALAAADDLVIGGTGSAPGPYRGHGPVHHGAGPRA